MIFRCVLQHVKEQNWTTVAIDFVIVVVGVFIGIQVSNWNVEQADRRQERVYLARLLADVDLSIETTEANLRGYSDGQILVVQSLQACVLAETDRDPFADGIADLGKVGPAGQFSTLQNSDLRDVLNGLASDRGYQAHVFEAINAQQAALTGVTAQRVVRTYRGHKTPFDPVGWDDLDFDALCRDPAFQGAVSQARYLTDAGMSLNDRALAKLRAAKAELAGRSLPETAPLPPRTL